jgi:hypothetical protein
VEQETSRVTRPKLMQTKNPYRKEFPHSAILWVSVGPHFTYVDHFFLNKLKFVIFSDFFVIPEKNKFDPELVIFHLTFHGSFLSARLI